MKASLNKQHWKGYKFQLPTPCGNTVSTFHFPALSWFCTLCRNTAEKKLWVCFVSFGCCLVFNPVQGPHVRGLSLRTQSGVYLPPLPPTASEQKWAQYASRQNTDLYPLYTFYLGGGQMGSLVATYRLSQLNNYLSCFVFKRPQVSTSPQMPTVLTDISMSIPPVATGERWDSILK